MAEPEYIKEVIQELNPDAIFIKGFDKALFGTGRVIGGKVIAVYVADECLQVLIDEHDMGEIESWEHFNDILTTGEPNPNKPLFVSDWRWAVDIGQVLKDIQIEKKTKLNDILDALKKKKEEEKNEKDKNKDVE